MLKERIAGLKPSDTDEYPIIADKVDKHDLAVLVVPIDSSAPKGRLILPQQQVIRELLECGCTAVVCREHELTETLDSLKKKPRYIITDSQAFKRVSNDAPEDICLTSFSILFHGIKAIWRFRQEGRLSLKSFGTEILC